MKINTLNKNRIIKSRDFICKDELRIQRHLIRYRYNKMWQEFKDTIIFKLNKYINIVIRSLKVERKKTRFTIPILGDAY